MPDFCAAFGCANERNGKTKKMGITFHRFPNDKLRRKAWTTALRRKGFEPKGRTVVCSCHFKPEDFDRTGQTTRLKEGAVPSIFIFSKHFSKVSSTSRSNRTPEKAAVEFPGQQSQSPVIKLNLIEESISDHQYAFNPEKAKRKLAESQERVEKLRRDLRNSKDRERRQKKTVKFLLKHLKEKQMLTEKLKKIWISTLVG